MSQSQIIECRSCGSKNRIPLQKQVEKAFCGKCGSLLYKNSSQSQSDNFSSNPSTPRTVFRGDHGSGYGSGWRSFGGSNRYEPPINLKLNWKAWTVPLVLLGILGIYPLIIEEAGSACEAVESRFVIEVARTSQPNDRSAVMGMAFVNALTQGAMAAGVSKGYYPNLPSSIGCYLMYYRIISSPDTVTEIARRLKQPML